MQSKTEVKKKNRYNYAPFSYRIKAFIVDIFMVYTPILYIITYFFMDGKDAFLSSDLAPFIAVSLYGLIYAILLSKFGHTPGKRAYNMKVLDAFTGEHISFFRALLRYILFLFTAATLLGLLLPLYRKDKKALHDVICNTVVGVEKK